MATLNGTGNLNRSRAPWRRLPRLAVVLELLKLLGTVGVMGCGYPELPRLRGLDAEVDGPPQFTSCLGLATTCGPGANESCCPAEAVPGGTFNRSYDGTVAYPDPENPATVGPFVLDVYEVTVGRFRAFVNTGLGTQESPPVAGTGEHPRIPGSGWEAGWNANLVTTTAELVNGIKCNAIGQTWTDNPGLNENKAMNCVTWFEAMAFCIWDGGYLPTEAEWNYAASGGSEQRAYPWSNPSNALTIDCDYANYRINSPAGTHCVNGTTGSLNRVGSESPKGNGRWNHADLAGNAYEWTFDWYDSSYQNPCDDCAALIPTTSRVIRGGSFSGLATSLRAALRNDVDPSYRDIYFGFRCARGL